jgi:dTDP-4-amino-4,6-dideoxygalactose transaminase
MKKYDIWLSAPAMCGREIEYVQEAFDQNWIAPLGPHVDGFEAEMCAYTGARHALAMMSGTGAIHMALRYLDAGPGDAVFCSSLTFAASCNPIIYQGATPVFIDSEPDSWNMSPAALERAFAAHPRPKAVIVVHLYGQSADMDKITALCDRHGVPIIEDAAESLGATYRGRQTGTLGRFGILSFNGNKIITTSGGGMLLCPDEASRTKILKWITQSRDTAPHYQHSELGFNYRLSNICAGIGRGQLTALEDRIRRKREIYEAYAAAFSACPATAGAVEMMPLRDYGTPNYWLSCFTLRPRFGIGPIEIYNALEADRIQSRPIWKPMQLQPFYEGYDYFPHDGDVSADIFRRGLCLPSDVRMTDEEQQRVVAHVRKICETAA